MLRSARPSSQSYQVAAVCGSPDGETVATTAGFAAARNVSISGGTGTRGTGGDYCAGTGTASSGGSSVTARTALRRTTTSVLTTTQPAAIRRSALSPISAEIGPASA